MPEKLSPEARTAALADLPAWTAVDGRDAITRTYAFRNFREAFGWMTQIALLAEKMDHHPEWSNIYKTVTVVLSTHDAAGLTALDIEMAKEMDRLFDR